MKILDADNRITTCVVGTLRWMAPELFEGHCPDEMTDVCSFCVVIYDGATECMPYAELTDGALIKSKVTRGRRRR